MLDRLTPLALAAALLLASACADPRPVAAVAAVEPSCSSCHGAPPATGAHLLHATPSSPRATAYGSVHVLEDVAPAGAGAYDFGCGSCHPLDPDGHLAHAGPPGVPDVVLDPAGAPSGSLRARNAPGARYDPATGTCAGVSCHSSGQERPVFVVTPPRTSPPGTLGCDGCHGNTPRYPSGGAGASDANSHVDLDLEAFATTTLEPTWEFGHFAGLPGPAHTPKHADGFYDVFDPPRIVGVSTIPIGNAEANEIINFNFNEKIQTSAIGFILFSESDVFYSNPIDIKIPKSDASTRLVTISNVSVLDYQGKALSEIKVGSTVQIQSESWIQFSADQKSNETPYTYYVQVKQSGKTPFVEFLGKYDGRYIGAGKQLQSIDWVPENSGLFFIETFVWDRNNIPIADQGPIVLIVVK